MKALSVAEFRSRKPIAQRDVDEFLRLAAQDDEFVRNVRLTLDSDYLNRLNEGDRQEIGRAVSNFIIRFLKANDLPVSGSFQLREAANNRFLGS